jgi:AcrR family transcriptional regulator
MARPLTFKIDDVTDCALAAFWRLGYDGCAISDLTAACGINRQSLYNTFTDKQGVFLAALVRYNQRLEAALAPLFADDADLASLRAFITHSLALQHQMHSGACLLVITAFSPHITDPAIAQAVAAGDARTRDAFCCVLKRQMPQPQAGAAYLYTVLSGHSALSRTGGSPADIDAALALAFTTLTASEPS